MRSQTVVLDCCSNEFTPFDFKNPTAIVELPKALNEISGLSIVDDSTIVGVQDEKGFIYVIDSRSGDIRERIRFAKNGDYEGIQLVGSDMYVLRSDGDLYRVTNWRSEEPSTERIETFLSERYDTEGLAFQSADSLLLIACKAYAGSNMKGFRAVYAFDLDVDSLRAKPIYAINFDAKRRTDFPGKLTDFEKKRDKVRGYRPSGLAVDPLTDNVYILSSGWKSIAVVSQSGLLVNVIDLPDKDFRQPEGIVFDPAGDLYIASEARGKDPTLLRYNRRTQPVEVN